MVSIEQRRAALVRRHHLAGDGAGPEVVTRALVALHASDPASVYVAVLARSSASNLGDVYAAMYGRRNLVRWMAMRRTLFVFSSGEVPMVQAAVSTPLAATLRRALVNRLERNGTEPVIRGEIGSWLARLEVRVADALRRRGSATGAELAHDEPALATRILPRAASDGPQRLTSFLLTVMSAEGTIVRSIPTGPWTSRHHRWEPQSAWWPAGLNPPDMNSAQTQLARRYLERFGPATLDDVQWWTGWSKAVTRRALQSLDLEEVVMGGSVGVDLAHRGEHSPHGDDVPPVATLLPALDPTPMGWKYRDWFLSTDPSRLFDRAGNIGPTIWWQGEIVGSWALTAAGDLRTTIVADRGHDAVDVIERTAAHLHHRLHGDRFTPVVRTPLERSLTDSN